MNLGELMYELRVNILNDRTHRISGDSDYLWTDATLVRYINEAERRFARQSLVIRDGTSPATQVVLVEGQALYPLHPSVMGVLSAKRADQPSDLTRVGHAFLAAYRTPSERWVDPGAYYALSPGAPLAFSTDEFISTEEVTGSAQQVTLRVYPTPSADQEGDILRIRVVRGPLKPMANDTDLSELPEDYQIDMLDWAAYRALRIVDDDAGNPRRAAEFRASFNDCVRRAQSEFMRKVFAPQAWGFGRHGFSWVR